MAKYLKGVPSWYNGNVQDLPYQNELDKVDLIDNEYQRNLIKRMKTGEFQPKAEAPKPFYDFSPANQDLINRPIQTSQPVQQTSQPQKKTSLLNNLLAPFSKENLKEADNKLLSVLQPGIKNWVKKDGGSAAVGAVNSSLLGLPKVLTEKLTGNKETAYSVAKETNPIAYTAGEIGGYLAPGIGATKALKPVTSALTKNVGSALGKQLIEGALVGGALDTTQGVIEGDNAKELLKRVGTGAVLGAGADIGLNKLGELVPKAIKGVSNFNLGDLVTTNKKVTEIGRPMDEVLNPKKLFNKDTVKTDLNIPIKPQESVKPNLDINTQPINNNAVKRQETPLIRLKKERVDTPKIDLPMNERDFNNVGSKTIKSFQYQLPEFKPEIQGEAQILKGELDRTLKAERGANANQSGEVVPYANTRVTSDSIASIKQLTGASYDKINKAIDNIIIDNGKENNALSKKIELFIDDRLSNGYTDDLMGVDIPPNADYILKKANIEEPLKFNTTTDFKGMVNNKNKVNYAKMEQPTPKQPSIDLTAATIDTPNYADIDSNEALFAESKFKTNTMRNAEILQGEETQKTIDNIAAMYEVKPNEQSVARAMDELSKNPQDVINRIKSSEALNNAEDATAAGLITNQLRQQADQTGDFTKLKEWLETVQPKVTNTAQGLQALSAWKKLTPEGALTKAQQVVGQVNREGKKLYGKNFTPVELTTDEIKFINDTMKKVESMADGREKDLEFAKVKKAIGEKIPPTLTEKIRTLRNISLLLNPKTAARNIVGNALMGVGDNAANTISATLLRPLDNYMSKITGMKTTALPSIKAQGKGFVQGTKDTLSDSMGGLKAANLKGKTPKEQAKMIIDSLANPVNTDRIGGDKFEINAQGSVFKGKPMKIVENALSTSLAIGDKPFSQAYYDDVINQLKKANKTTIVTDKMEEIAKKVAQERTYQDKNTLTSLAQGIKTLPKHIQNHPRLQEAIQIFVDSVLPYTKTPAAILKRGLEYTPEGVLEGVLKLGFAVKDNKLTPQLQREILDRISRGIVGTAIGATGIALANSELLTGAANKDKDVANFETQMGKQPFSLKIGNKNYSYSQYQPLSMPLGAGAQISQNKGKGLDALSTVADAASNALNYYSDQPMLQSIQRLAGSSNSSKGMGERILDSSLELPKQFAPTLLKQIAQTKDDTTRSTYSPNYLENNLLNQLKVKTPGLSKTLEPKVDTLGNEVKNFQGDNSLFNIFINPGYTTTENATPVQKLIMDAYNDTGDKTIFPRVADKSITYKNQPYDLTSKEFTEFQRYIGTETNKLISNDLDKISSMTPGTKAKTLQNIISKVYDEGKKKILEQRGVKIEK